MMWCPPRVCCVLLLLIHLVSAQESKYCRFLTEFDTKGDEAGRSERLLNQDISECKTLCLSDSSCVAVEFEHHSSTCYSYSADTSKTNVKGVTFLTKVCLTHDPASSVSSYLSASSVSGLDAADSTTPETPMAESTASLLDVLTTVAEPSSNSSDNSTDSPLVDIMDSANTTGLNVSASGEDMSATIDPSMSAAPAASGSASAALADSLGTPASISKSPDSSASLDIVPTSTLEAMTPSTGTVTGVTTPALIPSPTTIVTTKKTTVKADIPDKPVKTTGSPAVDKTALVVVTKTPVADTKPVVPSSKPPVTDAKSPVNNQQPAVGSYPNQAVPSNGSYPYPYPYPPYPYPPYPYPPYPYPGYPPYPPARYPNPFPVPQPQPQPQIPIYQLPKSTDPPITINRRTNRLCFNRNKFPDLKLPEEKQKFFLIPSGSDGKFSVVSVPSRYNPVVCFPVSYRGNVPILHLPSSNTPSSPYNPGLPQQNPFPSFPGLSVQSPGGQNYYQNQDGTIGVPIDIGKFLKEYGQGDFATTSPQTTVVSATPTAGDLHTEDNSTDVASGNATDIGSDASNSSLPDPDVNGTAVNNMTSLNGTDIDANATNEVVSNSTNNAINNFTIGLNETESMGNMTSFNSSFVDSNTTDSIEKNVTDATTPSTTPTTIPATTKQPVKKETGYGGPGPIRPGRWSKRRRVHSRHDKKRRRRPRPRKDPNSRYKGKHPMRFAQRHYLRRKKLSSRRSRAPQTAQPRSSQISSQRLRKRIDLRAKKLQ